MNQTVKIALLLLLAATMLAALVFALSLRSPARTTGEGGNISEGEVLDVELKDAPEKLIIAFGDSLTAGYGLPASEAYPALLEALLREKGASVRVVNSGVSGETTRGNLERAPFIRSQDPDLVLLGIGGNDMLRQLPVSETRANIDATLAVLRGGLDAPKVVLLRIQAPANAGPEYKAAFDSIYDDLARAYDIPIVPFVVPEVFLDPALLLSDRVHPNKTGYERIVREYILPAIATSFPAQ
jgi:acyl-CoA thioesterase-1